jgi:hypothetical protein
MSRFDKVQLWIHGSSKGLTQPDTNTSGRWDSERIEIIHMSINRVVMAILHFKKCAFIFANMLQNSSTGLLNTPKRN